MEGTLECEVIDVTITSTKYLIIIIIYKKYINCFLPYSPSIDGWSISLYILSTNSDRVITTADVVLLDFKVTLMIIRKSLVRKNVFICWTTSSTINFGIFLFKVKSFWLAFIKRVLPYLKSTWAFRNVI
jgi:hypothetical protein